MKSCFLAAACLLALSGTARANLITNGSFEAGTLTDPFTTVSAGQTNITGWTVNSGSVDYIGNYWQASNGSRSLDMSGTSAGTISQAFATTIGQQYLLTFDMAANPDDRPSVKKMNVTVGSTGGVYSFQAFQSEPTRGNMSWVNDSLLFTATSTSSLLTFASLNNSAYGPALDNVSVSAVPLPPALPMFGGALLALAAFGYLRRRNGAADSLPGGFAA